MSNKQISCQIMSYEEFEGKIYQVLGIINKNFDEECKQAYLDHLEDIGYDSLYDLYKESFNAIDFFQEMLPYGFFTTLSHSNFDFLDGLSENVGLALRYSFFLDTQNSSTFQNEDVYFMLNSIDELIEFLERVEVIKNNPTNIIIEDVFDKFDYFCRELNKYHTLENKIEKEKVPYEQFECKIRIILNLLDEIDMAGSVDPENYDKFLDSLEDVGFDSFRELYDAEFKPINLFEDSLPAKVFYKLSHYNFDFLHGLSHNVELALRNQLFIDYKFSCTIKYDCSDIYNHLEHPDDLIVFLERVKLIRNNPTNINTDDINFSQFNSIIQKIIDETSKDPVMK